MIAVEGGDGAEEADGADGGVDGGGEGVEVGGEDARGRDGHFWGLCFAFAELALLSSFWLLLSFRWVELVGGWF